MIKISHKGDFTKTTQFLKSAKMFDPRKVLDRYGKAGVAALSAATPTDTGLTAASWFYEITVSKGSYEIIFNNSNIQISVVTVKTLNGQNIETYTDKLMRDWKVGGEDGRGHILLLDIDEDTSQLKLSIKNINYKSFGFTKLKPPHPL